MLEVEEHFSQNGLIWLSMLFADDLSKTTNSNGYSVDYVNKVIQILWSYSPNLGELIIYYLSARQAGKKNTKEAGYI